MQSDEIKSIIPIECPHCSKQVIVEFNTPGPQLTSVMTPEIMNKAKLDAVAKIAKLSIPAEARKQAIEWLNEEETVVTPDGIETIMKNLEEEYKDL